MTAATDAQGDEGPHGAVEAVLDGDALARAALRATRNDRELAAALGRPRPERRSPTAPEVERLARRAEIAEASERSLVETAQRGDSGARAQLVEAYLPRIAALARIYRGGRGIEGMELLQEGVVGLLRALERYDAGRGPFWPYAAWWVRQAMQQLVAELTRPVVLSDRALRHLARVKNAYRAAVQETGREPSLPELVARADLAQEQVESLLAADRAPRSTDQATDVDGDTVGALGELLVDPLAEGEYERVVAAIEADELLALLAALSDRERAILRARFGLDGEEQSLRQIAERLGMSAERVRQLEQRALGKLHAAATDGKS